MIALELTMTKNPAINIIPSLAFYVRKSYQGLKLFPGLIGILIIFPFFLLSIPIFLIYVRFANSSLKKYLVKINFSTVPQEYKKYHSFYLGIKKNLNKISDKNGDFIIPNHYNEWYLRAIIKELIIFHSIMVEFKDKLQKELYFDLSELGISPEEISKAKSQLDSFKEDWENDSDWKSFEEKYNKFTLQS
jgi:hypothetical protein